MAYHICELRFENDLKTIVYFTNSGNTETAEDQTGRAKPWLNHLNQSAKDTMATFDVDTDTAR